VVTRVVIDAPRQGRNLYLMKELTWVGWAFLCRQGLTAFLDLAL
jgi:hypothetical protein